MSHETQELGRLFELSRDAVVGIEDGRIVFANPAAEAMLSVRVGDEAAQRIPEHILEDPAQRFLAAWRTESRRMEVSVVRSGALTLMCCAAESGGSGDGAVPSWERAMRELGSELMTMRLSLDAVHRNSDGHAMERYEPVLYRNYYRMKRLQEHITLAHEILSGSLPFRPAFHRLDDLFEELCVSVDAVASETGVRVIFERDAERCRLRCDADLMETMLLNLLANSLEHADPGDEVRVSLRRMGTRLVLSVDDPGRGIPPETMAGLLRVAEWDGKMTPTAGLGLIIVRGIAEKHGGSLVIESREGRGTCLRISLPVTEEEPGHELLLRDDMDSVRLHGMSTILTELSGLLGTEFYTERYFD